MIRRGSASLTRPLATRMIRRSSSRRPAWATARIPVPTDAQINGLENLCQATADRDCRFLVEAAVVAERRKEEFAQSERRSGGPPRDHHARDAARRDGVRIGLGPDLRRTSRRAVFEHLADRAKTRCDVRTAARSQTATFRQRLMCRGFFARSAWILQRAFVPLANGGAVHLAHLRQEPALRQACSHVRLSRPIHHGHPVY
jgi:hypothetical protein